MQESLKKIHFSNELIQDIENNSSIQSYKTGDVIMRTGQYINNTMLVTKALRFFRKEKMVGVLNVLFTARTSLPYQ
jgi:CRP/FNR family transcriptional regulator